MSWLSKIIKDTSMIKTPNTRTLFAEYSREELIAPKILRIAKEKSGGSPKIDAAINRMPSKAEQQATALIQEAKNEAAKIIETTKTEAKKLEQSASDMGYETGYEAGHRQGLEKGLEQFKQTTKRSIENLATIVEEVILQREKLIKNSETEIIEMAFAIAAKIIDAEITEDRDIVTRNARKALEKVVSDTRIKLKTAPQDFEIIKENIDLLAGKTGVSCSIDLIADGNITPGGCLIETDSGRIDVQIGAQLGELKKSLAKHDGKD